jgi:deoxyadenosine/deoxycytidine kinase
MVKILCIDGIIGCGKSSLIEKLNDEFTCFQEPVNEWSLLQNFYTDMKGFAAPFQLQVLFSFHKLYSNLKNIKDKVVVERCMWSSKTIFTNMLYTEGYITPEEYSIYCSFYNKVHFPIDVLIYLKVDTEIAFKRILNRDRASERSLKLDYLQKLNDKYNIAINDFKGQIYTIDANKPLDIVKEQVINVIKNY